MEIPKVLRQQIVAFLTNIPNIHEQRGQQAFLLSAGFDKALHDQLLVGGPPAQFVELLVSTCIRYGKLQDGRDALEAILEAAKQRVGTDKQEWCGQLLQDFRTLSVKKTSDLLKEDNLKNFRDQYPQLDAYFTTLQKRYSTIRLFSMPKPISLDSIYVHINVLDKPSIFRRSSKEQLEASFRENRSFGELLKERKDGLEMVREHDYLFILGKPGIGKTTFLKYVVLQAIQGDFTRIPVFISLNRFANSGKTLQEFIEEQFEPCGFVDTQSLVESLLQVGQTLLLCDGLDEVTQKDERRSSVIQELTNFIEKYATNQYLITCRVAATEYFFEQFTYIEIADFDDTQIRQFAKRYFDNSEEHAQFIRELERQKHLQQLSQTPLLLGFLCLVFEELQNFPSKRSQLYEETLDILLKKWDNSRGIVRDEIYKELSLKRKQQMFAQIAFETFEKGEYIFEQKFIEKTIAAYLHQDVDVEVVVKAIEAQHGIFTERASKLYSFSHLTFQEYFTARYIVEHIHKGTLKRLIHSHCTDDNWREVFLLTAEMLDDADAFFEIFLAKLDKMVRADKRLRQLLTTVKQEAAALQGEASPSEKRWAILALMLDTAHAVARALALDRASDRAFVLARILDRASYLALTLDPAHVLTLASASALDLANDLASVLARARVRVRDYDRVLVLARNLDLVKEMSKELGFTELYKRLKSISVPAADAADVAWETFSQTLLEIFQTHFSLEDYTFTEKQARHVLHYGKATELLQECLENAYVSDREAIMERLLRVPAAADRV